MVWRHTLVRDTADNQENGLVMSLHCGGFACESNDACCDLPLPWLKVNGCSGRRHENMKTCCPRQHGDIETIRLSCLHVITSSPKAACLHVVATGNPQPRQRQLCFFLRCPFSPRFLFSVRFRSSLPGMISNGLNFHLKRTERRKKVSRRTFSVRQGGGRQNSTSFDVSERCEVQ